MPHVESAVMYGKAKSGKIKQWRCWTEGDRLFVEYGYVDGKLQISETVCTPKNVGKANETTGGEQAAAEAESLIKARRDKERYRETIEELEELPQAPMLAKPYTLKHAVYPCYIQPKLNGVRCLAERINEQEIRFTSRKFKEFTTLAHLVPELLKFLKVGEIADGELYAHGWPFQDIISAVKKLKVSKPGRGVVPTESSVLPTRELQYWVYDLANENMTMERRRRALTFKFSREEQWEHLVDVHTVRVKTEKDMEEWHSKWVRGAFEGTIIRNPTAKYTGFRTKDLLKKKDFHDDEFEIVGAEQGKGFHKGCIVFVCQGGHFTFKVTPKYPLEKRREMYQRKESFYGKKLTVRYQELSKDGIPIFPIGIAIRDYE